MFPIILRIFGFALGVFAVIFGEADDSPGLQGIGLILLVAVFISGIKAFKRR